MNHYLFDTNILSETIKKKPDQSVVDWLDNISVFHSYISVLSIGEIRKGIEKIQDSRRKMTLLQWLENHILKTFGDHILPIDIDIADRWGRLCAEAKRPLPGIDSLLAATALHHDMVLVTRNHKDFTVPGLQVFNPWELSKATE